MSNENVYTTKIFEFAQIKNVYLFAGPESPRFEYGWFWYLNFDIRIGAGQQASCQLHDLLFC